MKRLSRAVEMWARNYFEGDYSVQQTLTRYTDGRFVQTTTKRNSPYTVAMPETVVYNGFVNELWTIHRVKNESTDEWEDVV